MPTDEAQHGAGKRSARTPAYPEPVDRLIGEFAKLPGIGRRSAERLALHVLKSPEAEALALAQAVRDAKKAVHHCRVCSNLSSGDLCAVCADPTRDRGVILVVEQPKDLIALEQTGMYRGLYHVLMGRLSPLEGIGPGDLTIEELLARVGPAGAGNATGITTGNAAGLREVVLGLNPTIEGDGTALLLTKELSSRGVKVSRLARGLPSGSQLEYANKAVLADAILGRHAVSE